MKISSPAVVLAVAGRLAARADFGTGRNVAVSCATIAAELHLQPATVKRVTRFLRRLGFLVNVVTGANRLTLEQLWEAAQRGAPNQRVNRPDFRSVLQVRMEHDEQEVFAGDA